MMRRALVVLVLLASAPIARAEVPATTPVERALGGVEWQPTVDKPRMITPSQLVEVARDPQTTPLRRRRAIALMRIVPTPEVRAYLSERYHLLAAADEGSPALELAAMLPLLAELKLIDEPTVQHLLAHRIAAIRQAAVVALSTLDKAHARTILLEHLASEKDSGVRAEINRRIAR